MKSFKLLIFGVPFLLAASITGVPAASAHAFPEHETPSAGQRLIASPSEVMIKFDAPIERLFAKLQVVNANGKPETIGSPQLGSDAQTLSIKLAALKPGDYTVKWDVVCIDSHHSQGSYVFTVGGGG